MEEGSFGNTNTERMAEGMRVQVRPKKMCVRESDSMRQWLEHGQGVWVGMGSGIWSTEADVAKFYMRVG